VKATDAYTDHFTFLDGDPKKVTNLDRSVTVGINPPDRVFFAGRAIDPTHLPTRLRPMGRRKKMGDLIGSLTGTLCSEKVKAIIETYEPGVHAFYPIMFEWKNGVQDPGHYIWIIQNEIKGLHSKLIDPPYTGPNDYWDGGDIIQYPNGKVVFSKEKVGNAHAWSDPQLSRAKYVSDELANAFFEAEVSGFAPGRHVDVV